MKDERVYRGKSKDGKLQDALNEALQQLGKDVSEGGIRDGLASWKLIEITGEYGGIAGFHSIDVMITAKRSPAWSDS